MTRQKITVIAGPTASGKTALSVELAIRLGAEIVCADSMQIYKGMQIATAKPTAEEMRGVRHHLVDFLEPSDEFSVADYVELARQAICDIAERNKPVIICGGTGLYIDSLVENIRFSETCSKTGLRDELNRLAAEKGNRYMLEMLREIDPETAQRLHENNLARIIRAIEIYRETGLTMSQQIKNSRSEGSPYQVCRIVLDYSDRQKLYDRIDSRVDAMVAEGLLDEARKVVLLDLKKTARQAIGYKELAPYFSGEAELSECIEKLKQSTRRYAKRQITWFKRSKDAHRLAPDLFGSFSELADSAEEIIRNFLNGGESNELTAQKT